MIGVRDLCFILTVSRSMVDIINGCSRLETSTPKNPMLHGFEDFGFLSVS